MKIKKLFKDSGMLQHHVMQLCDGSYVRFFITPYRKISERDITQVPHYTPAGNRGEEAENHLYKLYGLEKTNENEG